MKTSFLILILLLCCLLLVACSQQPVSEPAPPPAPEAQIPVAAQVTHEMAVQRSERLLLKARPGIYMDQFPVLVPEERYVAELVNGIKRVTDQPVSTFSIDVEIGRAHV